MTPTVCVCVCVCVCVHAHRYVVYEECLNSQNSWDFEVQCITDCCGEVRVIMFRAHAVTSVCVCVSYQ